MCGAGKLFLIFILLTVFPLSSGAVTVQEVGDLQMQLKKKELAEALQKKNETTGAAAPGGIVPNLPDNQKEKNEKTTNSDISLVAVYGINEDLTADVSYNGAVFSVKASDKVAGWTVGRITPTRIEINKPDQKRDLTLSIKPTAMLPPPLPPSGNFGNPKGVPSY